LKAQGQGLGVDCRRYLARNQDGILHVNRESDKYAAFHGLTRALVFNAVQGVTVVGRRNWTSSASGIAPS